MGSPHAHPRHYDEDGFWRKLRGLLKKASRGLLEKALWLYYALKRDDLPAWARTAILGALGYLILPLDLIPDVLLPLGLTDDLGVIVSALATVARYVGPEEKRQAEEKLRQLGL
jgi:uncharacterized membrane protein YkvA (DUF1232 family)